MDIKAKRMFFNGLSHEASLANDADTEDHVRDKLYSNLFAELRAVKRLGLIKDSEYIGAHSMLLEMQRDTKKRRMV